MKAIRVSQFGGTNVLKLGTNVEIPEICNENQVLIQVKAIGVNPVDTYIRAGTWFPSMNFPYTPGTDAAGLVVAVGAQVTNVKVGDRVYTCDLTGTGSGSYAEYKLAPSNRVFLLPDRFTFSQGAALGIPYFTAVRALKYRAQAKSDESVLIHGASGGVGLAACQVAKGWGLDVVGTASTDEGSQLVKQCGARVVLNHKDPKHCQNLREAGNGRGFDVILEMLSNVNLPIDMEVASPKTGRIIIIGARGKVEIDPRLMIMESEVKIMGVVLPNNTDAEWEETAKELAKGMDGAHWVNPIIDQELPLGQAAQAHNAVMEHSGGSRGKIILIP